MADKTPQKEITARVHHMESIAGSILLAAELAVASDAEMERLLTENPMLPCSSSLERSLVGNPEAKPLSVGILEPESLDFIRAVNQAGRAGEARRLCMKALRWQPSCSALWEYQAEAEDELGEHEIAARLRRIAARCGEPTSTTKRELKSSITWTLHGGALIGRGQFKAARAGLERAYSLGQDNEDRALALGSLGILVHLREAALAEMRTVMGLRRSVMMGTSQEAYILREIIVAGDLANTALG